MSVRVLGEPPDDVDPDDELDDPFLHPAACRCPIHWQDSPEHLEALQWLQTEVDDEPAGDKSFLPLSAIDRSPPPPLVLDRIDPEGHSLLYGTGDVGKGTLTASWIARFVETDPSGVLILDYENHPGEWARRIGALLKDESDDTRIWWAGPLRPDWPGRGPIWGHVQRVRKIVENYDIGLVVVDSIVPACGGGDALESGTPGRYFGATQSFGVPVLSLAHVTKADDLRYPFGSVFWHNLCRVSWSLGRTAGGRLELVNRKANNYEKQGRFEVSITWHDDQLGEVWERPYSAALGELIDEALADGPLTVSQIAQWINDAGEDDEKPVKSNSVRVTLARGMTGLDAKYTVTGTGQDRRLQPEAVKVSRNLSQTAPAASPVSVTDSVTVVSRASTNGVTKPVRTCPQRNRDGHTPPLGGVLPRDERPDPPSPLRT
jgi:hypothetical protein